MYEGLKHRGIQNWWTEQTSFNLDPKIIGLRDDQRAIVEWALRQPTPYLLVNAPTGIGKTLAGGTYAASLGKSWTYAVSTKALQDQVSRDLGIPTLKGRDNFACLVGQATHGFDITASRGKCVFGESCMHDESATVRMCDYYQQKGAAFSGMGRVTNYAMALSMPELLGYTSTYICDEAHRLEETVISSASITLNRMLFMRYRVKLPYLGENPTAWSQWARGVRIKPNNKYDITARKMNQDLEQLRKISGEWRVDDRKATIRLAPVFGSEYVLRNLFNHRPQVANSVLTGKTGLYPVSKAIFMSATLLAPDLMERMLGLPPNSYSYLDLPSPFPKDNRPINYRPVMPMSVKTTSTPEGRRPMQEAMDKLIEHYLLKGDKCGIIHAVSRRYRDQIVEESRWKGVMTTDPLVHSGKSNRKEASVLVSDNIIDGWDGADDLCRFVIMPKVPFPNLGDKAVLARQTLDPRSYDYQAVVSIIQGVGRGVRHETDHADSWILDSNWDSLMKRRMHWLPKSFLDVYKHGVSI